MWRAISYEFIINTSLTVKQRCVFLLSNFLIVTTSATNKAIATTVTIASSINRLYIINMYTCSNNIRITSYTGFDTPHSASPSSMKLY